jgi:hypothetical protein
MLMVIIFQLSRLLGVVVGLAVGGLVGFGASAWAGVPIGVVLGFSAGFLVGALVHEFAVIGIRLGLKCSNTTKLKARLGCDYCLSHLIIAELVNRGEPSEQFRGHVESLPTSASGPHRSIGKRLQRQWFHAPRR